MYKGSYIWNSKNSTSDINQYQNIYKYVQRKHLFEKKFYETIHL